MLGWIARSMIRRSVRSLNAGDSGPLLSSCADDVHFTIRGDHSWAADVHGKAELATWLQRFIDTKIHFTAREIVVGGWPWRMTFAIHFSDEARDDGGEVVYANEGVVLGTIAWGKIKTYAVYEDTQKVAAFDEYLAAHPRG